MLRRHGVQVDEAIRNLPDELATLYAKAQDEDLA
jgi:hypothetical protein